MPVTSNAAPTPPSAPTEQDLLACLPPDMQDAGTTMTSVAAGNSGAAVYFVERNGARSVLKVTSASEPLATWERAVAIQRAAAEVGVAPAVLHADAARRAVVSAFVRDESFRAWYANIETRAAAITELGRVMRAIHALPVPADLHTADRRGLLATVWAVLAPEGASSRVVPAFAYDTAQRLLAEAIPESTRAAVLSHNDANPTNLVYSGGRLMLLDWQTTALNDPYYDLATLALFLRMDDATSLALLSAYDDATVTDIPARFTYDRRVAAVLSGSASLYVAHLSGHRSIDGDLPIPPAPALGDIYRELGNGTLSLASPAGQWRFGLALIKASMPSA